MFRILMILISLASIYATDVAASSFYNSQDPIAEHYLNATLIKLGVRSGEGRMIGPIPSLPFSGKLVELDEPGFDRFLLSVSPQGGNSVSFMGYLEDFIKLLEVSWFE